MFSASIALVMICGLLIAVLVAVYLPWWASGSLALAAVVLVSVGGGVLLAKAAAVCALVLLAVLGWRRRNRPRSQTKLAAIPQMPAPAPRAAAAGERRAA